MFGDDITWKSLLLTMFEGMPVNSAAVRSKLGLYIFFRPENKLLTHPDPPVRARSPVVDGIYGVYAPARNLCQCRCSNSMVFGAVLFI